MGAENSPLKEDINLTKELTISYKQSVFSIGFAALNYVSSSKNQYAYVLEGFDQNWNYIGTRRVATYTNINPGEYIFRVKGSNNDGIWNEEGRSIKIIITPPIWQTWWFRFVGFLFILTSIIIGHKIRTARIRAQNKVLEQRVNERTAQLEYSNKELEAFSYSISHDLRAPLRGMDGFSQLLLDEYAGKLGKQGKDYLHRIQKGSRRMGKLIDSLLKLSHLSRTELHFKKVDLSRLVESIAHEYKKAYPDRNTEFVIVKDIYVKGDASLLRVMLKNLIDNAWKFTAETINPVIEFGTARKYRTKLFYIRDNGVGFDIKYSDSLFELFQRQHPDFDGTGIGLAIVQRIVNRHGGTIRAEGKVNKGATFYFTIGT